MAQRTYVIPLRREFLKVPRYQRSKKAITAIREFLVKHLKTDKVLLGPKLNETVWKDGIKSPPHKVKVTASIVDGVAKVELFGHEYPKAIEKATKAPQGLKEKLQAAVSDVKGGSKAQTSSQETSAKEEEPKAESKAQEKAQTKEEASKSKAAEAKKEAKDSQKKESKPVKEGKPKSEKKAEPAKDAAKK
ncbi:50S ribosomal protein L31e [Candidatus Woesearchaeota archaeon]|nr:MAG: 50S ribosomal protein L31e [Candidatus Woesearchaeota archaeon]